ncbi:MAG: hypothetical protein ISR76_03700 [Planctomycetes bacterium]|nr:hypothetical protein [Planctomycetota bacterium]MBL7008076.1 hypothetical protein [Planctomycetota bacterium]
MPRLLPIVLLVLLAPAACVLPPDARPNAEPLAVRVVQDRAPANIAVLAIEVEPTAGLVPVEDLRGFARKALMDRGFTPLAAGYVDQASASAVPASSLRLPEAGVLALRVGRWNDVRAASQGVLQARVVGVLYDEAGRIVAQVGVDQELRLSPSEYAATVPELRRDILVQRLFEALLAPLPAPPAL